MNLDPERWLSPQVRLQGLERQLRAGRIVPFVGAGISMQVGLPSWPRLVERLYAAAIPPAGAHDLLDAAGGPGPQQMPDDLLLATDLCKRLLGNQFHAEIKRAFTLSPAQVSAIRHSDTFRHLARLPCTYWLTTNYDLVLEVALKAHRKPTRADSFSWSDESAVNRFIMRRHEREKTPAVIHVHGRLDRPEDIVLTEADYQQRYWWSGTERVRLTTALATYSALFLGTSLTDEDLKTVLREIKGRFRFEGGQHFWLRSVETPDPDNWERGVDKRSAEAEHWQRKFGVDIIDYPSCGPDHTALATVLGRLADAAEAPDQRRRAAQAPQRRTPMEGIGPVTVAADPQKGRFGGEPARMGYTLSADVALRDKSRGWYTVALAVVRGLDAPEAERATFYLHDTFKNGGIVNRTFEGDRASLRTVAWGAFTVGAEVHLRTGGRVLLELDLAQQDSAPEAFRTR
jgi:hypothetical protein